MKDRPASSVAIDWERASAQYVRGWNHEAEFPWFDEYDETRLTRLRASYAQVNDHERVGGVDAALCRLGVKPC